MSPPASSAARPTRPDTASAVLDVAQELAQQRGFHGFSYRDIAEAIGTTTTAVHYHFRSKDDLGAALVSRYARDFDAALATIDASGVDAFDSLEAYRTLYQQVIDGSRLCLCAMLAAESETLPETTRHALAAFFDANVDWLTRVLARGSDDGTLVASAVGSDAAETIVAGLEGAMLLAWNRKDPGWFARVSASVIAAHRAPTT